MAYYRNLYGGEGEASSPLEPAYGHVALMVRKEAYRPGRPIACITNGILSINAYEQIRSTGLIAQAMVPVVPVFDPDPDYRRWRMFSDNMKEITGVSIEGKWGSDIKIESESIFHEMFKLTRKEVGPDVTEEDITKWLYSRFADVELKGVTAWNDQLYNYMGWTKDWFVDQMNEIQYKITNMVQNVPEPVLQQVGYAALSVNGPQTMLKVVKLPGAWTNISKRTKIKGEINVDPIPRATSRQQAAYLLMGAMMLRRLITIEGYTMADYVAIVHQLLMQYVNVGATTFSKWFSAQDIMDRVPSLIGMGEFEANPFRVRNIESREDVLFFNIVFGILVARILPTTTTADYRMEGNIFTGPPEVEAVMTSSHFPDLGPRSMPFLQMPYNQPGSNDTFLPCIVRTKMYWGRKYLNEYKRLHQFVTMPSIEMVEIRRATVSGMSQDLALDAPTRWYKYKAYSDWIKMLVRRPMRDLIVFRWPRTNTYPGELTKNEMEDKSRRVLHWFMGLFASAGECMKQGYIVKPGLGLVDDVLSVRYYVDNMFEAKIQLVDEKGKAVGDSQTQLEQTVAVKERIPAPPAKEAIPVLVTTDQDSVGEEGFDEQPGSDGGEGTDETPDTA